MTTYAIVEVEGTEFRIEVDQFVSEGEVQASLEQVTKKLEGAFDDAMALVKNTATSIANRLCNLTPAPSEISVEFGVKIDSEVGALIAKASSGAHFKISLKWSESKTT